MKDQPPQVADRLAACRVGDVVISAITAAELEFGVEACGEEADRNRGALEQFLVEVPVVPFDRSAARADGPVRWAMRQRRRAALDKLIAAHALALGVTLVTNNPADIQPYADLRIENWLDG